MEGLFIQNKSFQPLLHTVGKHSDTCEHKSSCLSKLVYVRENQRFQSIHRITVHFAVKITRVSFVTCTAEATGHLSTCDVKRLERPLKLQSAIVLVIGRGNEKQTDCKWPKTVLILQVLRFQTSACSHWIVAMHVTETTVVKVWEGDYWEGACF